LFLRILREQTAASPDDEAAALMGLRAYQEARRSGERRLARVAYRRGRARLRRYGTGKGRPVVFVPSLINPPHILDLTNAQSLLRWIAAQHFNAFLVDWGSPDVGERDLDIGGHVEQLLLPLLDRLPEPPVIVGYCLGGTIAAAAATARPVAGLATIAAPWRFDGFGPHAKAEIAALWGAAKPLCDAMGLVPMEVLQSGFWRLDPVRTIAKYARFAGMPRTSAAARQFIALEEWANAGAPLTFAAGRQLFEECVANDLPGKGQWSVAGRRVDPLAIGCPSVDFVSLSDRIVPAATASGMADQRDLSAGHVGMIVGSKAEAQLWKPLADWLSGIPGTR